MNIRALVVDDEPLARKRITVLLRDDPRISVIGECGAGREAIKVVQEETPDLLFLDVQMPEVGGFDVLQGIAREHMPVVIFITAYEQHALKAFEVHALDYLLKPFTQARFAEAVERAIRQVAKAPDRNGDTGLTALIKSLRPEASYLSRFVVKTCSRVVFVTADEVEWIESAANYALLHAGTRTHVVRETIRALEKKLSPKLFQRISRSTIVNLKRIKELQPLGKGDYIVILDNGKQLSMSRGIRDFEHALQSG
jgi:two-component system LytT family response regulator